MLAIYSSFNNFNEHVIYTLAVNINVGNISLAGDCILKRPWKQEDLPQNVGNISCTNAYLYAEDHT